jgi:hypothetical protein
LGKQLTALNDINALRARGSVYCSSRVRVLALYCVVYLFGRRAHCRLMHLPELMTHLTEMFTEDNLRIYVDANRDLDKNQKPSMVT